MSKNTCKAGLAVVLGIMGGLVWDIGNNTYNMGVGVSASSYLSMRELSDVSGTCLSREDRVRRNIHSGLSELAPRPIRDSGEVKYFNGPNQRRYMRENLPTAKYSWGRKICPADHD